eukprot:3490254-Amphidinium_carterae.1
MISSKVSTFLRCSWKLGRFSDLLLDHCHNLCPACFRDGYGRENDIVNQEFAKELGALAGLDVHKHAEGMLEAKAQ